MSRLLHVILVLALFPFCAMGFNAPCQTPRPQLCRGQSASRGGDSNFMNRTREEMRALERHLLLALSVGACSVFGMRNPNNTYLGQLDTRISYLCGGDRTFVFIRVSLFTPLVSCLAIPFSYCMQYVQVHHLGIRRGGSNPPLQTEGTKAASSASP